MKYFVYSKIGVCVTYSESLENAIDLAKRYKGSIQLELVIGSGFNETKLLKIWEHKPTREDIIEDGWLWIQRYVGQSIQYYPSSPAYIALQMLVEEIKKKD